jgi:hypothetical protein
VIQHTNTSSIYNTHITQNNITKNNQNKWAQINKRIFVYNCCCRSLSTHVILECLDAEETSIKSHTQTPHFISAVAYERPVSVLFRNTQIPSQQWRVNSVVKRWSNRSVSWH